MRNVLTWLGCAAAVAVVFALLGPLGPAPTPSLAAPDDAPEDPPAPAGPKPRPQAPAALAWPQLGGTAAHGNVVAEKNVVLYPRVRWHAKDARGQPTLGHGAVYSGGKRLLRIDRETGQVLAHWTPSSELAYPVVGAPALDERAVLVSLRDGRAVALTPDLSKTLWTHTPPAGTATAWSAGALADGTFVRTVGEEVFAVHARDGSLRWRHAAGSEVASMTPAIHEGRVYVGTDLGRLLCLSLATGDVLWKHDGESEYGWTDPVVAWGKVFLADRGVPRKRLGALNAFDAASGKPLWQTVFGATGCSTPGVRERLLVAGFGRSVAYFDPDTGERSPTPDIRTTPNAFGSPTFIGDTLYYGNLAGSLHAHDAKTGAPRWVFRLRSGIEEKDGVYTVRGKAQVHDFAYVGGRLYVSTTRGLYALEQDPAHETAPTGFVLLAQD